MKKKNCIKKQSKFNNSLICYMYSALYSWTETKFKNICVRKKCFIKTYHSTLHIQCDVNSLLDFNL